MSGNITAELIADVINEAPAWSKIGLTVRSERLRDDARLELAQHVYSALYGHADIDAGQLRLPL